MGEDTGEDTKKGTPEFWAGVRAATEARAAEVPQTVTNHYVDKEIDSRVELTISAVDTLANLEKQLKKLRPDQEQYDAEGKLLVASYSKAKLEERKKIIERQERIETALRDVFENGAFEKLKKLDLGTAGKNNDAA